jgi:hypothetical protein
MGRSTAGGEVGLSTEENDMDSRPDANGPIPTRSDEDFDRQFVKPLMSLEVSEEQARRLIAMVSERGRRMGLGRIDMKAAFPTPEDADQSGSANLDKARNRADLYAFLGQADPKKVALESDAERLAALREKLDALAVTIDHLHPIDTDSTKVRMEFVRMEFARVEFARVSCLIVVYEECAARGLTFGGDR